MTGGKVRLFGIPADANVVRLDVEKEVIVDDCKGASARRKEFGSPESKKDSSASSARTSIRKVGRVRWRGWFGSRAALADARF